jgi:hypothetical protein
MIETFKMLHRSQFKIKTTTLIHNSGLPPNTLPTYHENKWKTYGKDDLLKEKRNGFRGIVWRAQPSVFLSLRSCFAEKEEEKK